MIIITSFTSGEATKKLNVMPRGIPASRKLINNGTAEQEQNGVSTPNKPAARLAFRTGILISRSRVFPTGNHDLINAIMNTIRARRRNIFSDVAIKNVRDCPSLPDEDIENRSMTRNLAVLSFR